ncbi:cell division topological specificity factor MinE [Natranaerofaba carboxydovora]|uniref:cell division topological specificity factor MinE n=1 Tax=Natranaerofaba carboxydovora TaxID=2742683 RepID=UPI001F149414|nr:cell division topological specificity factor MinE [Natranaerofaba carboxydovora]UMZ72874.1 Cell division topological specificity factor [Natranaerofaba carboxydovora]
MFNFRKKKDSKSKAKDRLKLLLVHDRANVSSDLIEEMREEILQVISKYMEIDEDNTEINLTKEKNTARLEANMSVKSIKRNAAR